MLTIICDTKIKAVKRTTNFIIPYRSHTGVFIAANALPMIFSKDLELVWWDTTMVNREGEWCHYCHDFTSKKWTVSFLIFCLVFIMFWHFLCIHRILLLVISTNHWPVGSCLPPYSGLGLARVTLAISREIQPLSQWMSWNCAKGSLMKTFNTENPMYSLHPLVYLSS